MHKKKNVRHPHIPALIGLLDQPSVWIVIIILCAFVVSCDSDRLFGTNYEAKSISARTEINGLITNVFTGEVVPRAEVRIGFQSTRTRNNGQFQLDYILGSDEALNAQIPVLVTADKYLPTRTSTAVLPQGTYVETTLEYGAPIILEGTIDSTESDTSETRVQFWGNATVFDYQGVEDIDSVYVRAFYWNQDSAFGFRRLLPLDRVEIVDDQTARYRGLLPDTIDTYGLTDPHFEIVAIDKFPFVETQQFLFFR